MANAHKRVNSLVKIKINGSWVTEECDIKDGVVQVFYFFVKKDEWRPKCNGLQVGVLEGEDAAMLETPFSEEEVFVLSRTSMEIKFLVLMGRFVKSINAYFLVLISKKGGIEDLKDFRPISLVGILYKLLAKVLANRLKKVMGKIVSKSQNTFVEGRQILDASLIANEAIDSMQKSGVVTSFVNWILGRCRPCKLEFSSLVAGKDGLGLETEGSLSPYIFVTVMEVLSCLLKRANEGGFCRGGSLVVEEIISAGRVENVEDLALEFGCKVSTLSSSYLGLPLGVRFKEVAVWDEVEKRY
ncbi:hypothetical protein CK203_043008 [Vitis vinifera]|uniref:Reverse transcriptase domain-containing protein n=1 Tax=Vitis vinifera TaxID=29760 RepID=A0A438GZ85_VITVI|nr:hypothetical protein CK203_043008 [Vitis vinifera]